jgi:hypothetical protein
VLVADNAKSIVAAHRKRHFYADKGCRHKTFNVAAPALSGAQATLAASVADLDAAEDDGVAERLERLGKANAGLFR